MAVSWDGSPSGTSRPFLWSPIRSRNAADVGGEDGASGGHRLDQRNRHAFVVRARDEHVQIAVDLREIGAPSGENHPIERFSDPARARMAVPSSPSPTTRKRTSGRAAAILAATSRNR